MENQILPQLDISILQQKANEYAMAGATKTIEDFYAGYNSPFRKAVEDELKKVSIDTHKIALPDIIGILNEQLTKKIDEIANEAIAKSFVPLVNRFLTGLNKELLFSDVLKEFIEVTKEDSDDHYEVSVEPNYRHNWLNVNISKGEMNYEFTLHQTFASERSGPPKYHLLSLPYNSEKHKPTMKLSIDGVKLEMPFTSGILEDRFISYLAKTIISQCEITMDCKDFDEEWFHDEDGCHCH